MDLDSALAKHAEWKLKFRSAINKEETLDAATIAKDNCCELGKWLHGEAKTSHGKLPAHGEVVAKHAAFHVEAGRVAVAINAKKFKDASAMLDNGTAFANASAGVGVAIMRLKKDVASKHAA